MFHSTTATISCVCLSPASYSRTQLVAPLVVAPAAAARAARAARAAHARRPGGIGDRHSAKKAGRGGGESSRREAVRRATDCGRACDTILEMTQRLSVFIEF